MSDNASTSNASSPTPMESCLATWHDLFSGDRSVLDRILADDAVLHSPVLFKPIEGKDMVKLYLTGASMTFVGEPAPADQPRTLDENGWDRRFRYVRKVVGSHDAVLEFETTMNGKYVNGVDMITCDDDGKITDFKVMIRPRQALEAVSQMMVAALDTLQSSDA